MNQEEDERYISGTPQHGEGGVWPPLAGHQVEQLLPPIDEVVAEGMDLIRGELLPLLEKRVGQDKAGEIREMLTLQVKEFHNTEPVRIYVAIEELAAQDLLDADRASELFYLMKEGIVTNREWRARYGKEGADMANKRVRGLIAQSDLVVSADSGKRPYAVTDLVRYEKDLAA